ncbi:hypothetical protein J7I93_03735 [Bacillus sp. ISL-47]|uniref:hypothetical protein n=1 Tax=Bacillus sp. ISL-47 TaxID=2819130 RepID=UPI001BE6371C|nr:hypothetical protein [Bacillus sp. ISL-47]MBT2687288.1 hypothetical protein [Bacillus sp. ISL-47]MBT2706642.1 hypothetical protein [Pseudomonas sp. ISL-84]
MKVKYDVDIKYAQVEQLYKEGKSCTKIGEILGLNRKKVSKYLQEELGYKVRVIAGNHNKEEIHKKYLEGEQLFIDGMSINRISKHLKIHKKSFSNWLQVERGHTVKPKRGLTIEEKVNQKNKMEYAERLIKEGHSFHFAVKKTKVNYYKFKNHLKEKGYELSFLDRKYNISENIFENIDTEENAYWLGLLYADAYVTNDCRYVLELCLKAEDLNHLIKFREFMKSDHPIVPKEVKLGDKIYRAYRFSIYSKKLVLDLIKQGCLPRKSLILKFPSSTIVPENLVRHFLRGYWDGDGTISFTKLKQHGYKYCSMSVISTTEFVEKIRNTLDLPKVKLNPQGNAYSLRYTGANFPSKILDFIYQDASIYLPRKYAHYKSFLSARIKFEKKLSEQKEHRVSTLNKAINLFNNGKSIREISTILKFERAMISSWLNLNGINVRLSRPFSKEELAIQKLRLSQGEEFYQKYNSVSKASKLASINYHRLKLYLIQKGYPLEF